MARCIIGSAWSWWPVTSHASGRFTSPGSTPTTGWTPMSSRSRMRFVPRHRRRTSSSRCSSRAPTAPRRWSTAAWSRTTPSLSSTARTAGRRAGRRSAYAWMPSGSPDARPSGRSRSRTRSGSGGTHRDRDRGLSGRARAGAVQRRPQCVRRYLPDHRLRLRPDRRAARRPQGRTAAERFLASWDYRRWLQQCRGRAATP